MRADSRLVRLLAAGALALVPAIALAQQAPPADNPPPADSVGPKELQNFSLNGTVTRTADQPVAVPPAPAKRQPQAEQTAPQPTLAAPSATQPAKPARAVSPNRHTEAAAAEQSSQLPVSDSRPEQLRQSPPASSVTVALPNLGANSASSAAAAGPPPSFPPAPQPTGTLAPEHRMPLLPWLLAAFALAAAGLFLFWRTRGREALAGGPEIDLFTAPAAPPTRAPAPEPAPRAAPPAESPPPPVGIVSTRLRPWVEIGFQPLRCILEDERAILEFELELFNSGSAPARAVLVEGSLFNAGPAQDAELGRFFANPVTEGERIAAIPPLKRAALKTQVAIARNQLLAYELGGRQAFVPLIAFNALYSWGGGEGQTSVAYLLGRDTKGEKLAPFHLDLGPRIFRGLAARPIPSGIRR